MPINMQHYHLQTHTPVSSLPIFWPSLITVINGAKPSGVDVSGATNCPRRASTIPTKIVQTRRPGTVQLTEIQRKVVFESQQRNFDDVHFCVGVVTRCCCWRVYYGLRRKKKGEVCQNVRIAEAEACRLRPGIGRIWSGRLSGGLLCV